MRLREGNKVRLCNLRETLRGFFGVRLREENLGRLFKAEFQGNSRSQIKGREIRVGCYLRESLREILGVRLREEK